MMIRRLTIATGTALAFAALTVLVVLRAAPVIGFDTAVNKAALHAALAAPAWRSFMLAVTSTGGPVFITTAATLAVAALLILRRFRDALFVAVAVLGPILLRLPVLNAIARPRPPERLAPSGGWSYPSGHTTATAAAALALILVTWPRLTRRGRLLVAVPAATWAVAVGLSRIALSVHWPTDVLGAWLFTTTLITLALPLRTPPPPAPATDSPVTSAGPPVPAHPAPGPQPQVRPVLPS